MMLGLIPKSIQLIVANQARTGAYLASPGFANYRYAWLRDGTFTAYAMDRVGQYESARRFYEWCDRVIQKHVDKARMAIQHVRERAGEPLDHQLFLHTRYTVDGDEVEGEWGSFQLDGYGTWLWGLAEHVRLSGEQELLHKYAQSIELTLDYLAACWRLPNFDCWEEAGDRLHPATLAALYGGIKAIEPHFPRRADECTHLAAQIRQVVCEEGVNANRFIKSWGNPTVDASALWMSLPYGLVSVDDPIMTATVEQIERELMTGCGVHRYAADTYYGGGEWLLLTAWMGWYYVRIGKREQARKLLEWIASKDQPAGLPEQVLEHLLSPEDYQAWLEREGPPAVPLLWSHAMFLVLAAELELVESVES
jgi:GH15 family glucan-1,4-alpha-glucosidase